MGSKSEMLAAIRAALGGAPGRETIQGESTSAAPSIGWTSREDLANLFCVELKKVGGHTIQVQSSEDIREYVEQLLGAHAPTEPDLPSLAVSDGAHRLVPSLRGWLQSRGFGPVLSLRESRSIDAPQYKRTLFTSAMGVTTADFAIADTGTVVLVSERNPQPPSGTAAEAAGDGGDQHRLISLVPPVHVCLLDTKQILPNLAELITHVNRKYYRDAEPPLAMTFITGPSRTADIELTLTMGVHGPRELHVLLYDSPLQD